MRVLSKKEKKKEKEIKRNLDLNLEMFSNPPIVARYTKIFIRKNSSRLADPK
jgi:hypothetical protein